MDLSHLNENQARAVTLPLGPSLIIAGPGSGKTHVIIFWCGLICDTLGTLTMGQIAKSSASIVTSSFTQSLHGITGFLAIVLMLFHALWATYVLLKGNEDKKKFFHKFSIVVWAIWLIPYFIGMFIGMMG